MGNRIGEEIWVPNFTVEQVRCSVHLYLQLNSLHTRVVSLEVCHRIIQIIVWEIITWETSTMVPTVSQDLIFDVHVRLDIWRWRGTRITHPLTNISSLTHCVVAALHASFSCRFAYIWIDGRGMMNITRYSHTSFRTFHLLELTTLI